MTGTAITTEGAQRSAAVNYWDDGYKRLITATVLCPKDRDATGPELALFAEQCERTKLNPFLGQIYGIYRYDSRAGGEVMTVQVGIDGFRIQAERSRKYQGQTPVEWCDANGTWVDVWLSDEPPAAARVGVLKRGNRAPIVAVATWREYAQTKSNGSLTSMWKNMPANQLAKCAEALALRKAFPAELSGLTTADEEHAASHVEPTAAIAAAADVETTAVEAAPAEPDDNGVSMLAAVVSEIVERDLLTPTKLMNRLVAAGATTTATVRDAVDTVPAENQEAVASDLADLIAANEAQDQKPEEDTE